MNWIKYRTKWAWGTDEWVYHPLFYIDQYDKEVLESYSEDFIEDIHQDHNYSDKYRGVDYEVIDKVPLDIIEEKIKRTKGALENKKYELEILGKEIEDA